MALSLSHAEHLSYVADTEFQLELAELVSQRRLSLHQLEKLTRKKGVGFSREPGRYANYIWKLREEERKARPEDAKNVVIALYKALNERKLDLLDGLFDKNYVMNGLLVFGGKEVNNADDLKWFLQEELAAIPDLRVSVDDILTEGNRVAISYTETGTPIEKGFDGLIQNGKRLTIKGASIYRIEENKIVEEWCLERKYEFASPSNAATHSLSNSRPAGNNGFHVRSGGTFSGNLFNIVGS